MLNFKNRIVLLLLLLSSGTLLSQIRITAQFDNGSMGSYKLLDSVWIKRGTTDSIMSVSVQVESRRDPLNPVDTSLSPSARWYHFKMEGVKDKLIFLNILNSEVRRPFYSYDMVNYTRFGDNENLYPRTLNKIFTRDTVYIAYFIPYTYIRHVERISEWSQKPFVLHQVIGNSSQGLPIDMLRITDNSAPDDSKEVIWIHGRVHTSEAPAAWHLDGIIEEILSDTPFAAELRKNAIFYIVPETNPDGVFGGYSRSTSTGVNIEINWDRPDSTTMPEVKALKAAMTQIAMQRPIDLMLNMHSQVANSITYWIHSAKSTSDEYFKVQSLLSALTINHSSYYRSVDQLYSDIAPRYAEGWLWNQFGEKTLAITFETPYTYYNDNREGVWVHPDNLKELAHSSLLAVSDLLNLDKSVRIIADSDNLKRVPAGWSAHREPDKLFFGKTYLTADKTSASIRLTISNLAQGEYTLYKWAVGPVADSFPEDINVWKEVGKVVQKRDGKYVWRYKAQNQGEIIDAIILVKI
jgi:Predicted carboxypeptidase